MKKNRPPQLEGMALHIAAEILRSERRSPKKNPNPKARVMFMDLDGSVHPDDCPTYASKPCLVIPMHSQSAAKALARWWNLGEERRREAIADRLEYHEDMPAHLDGPECYAIADAILSLINGGKTK